MSGGDDRARAIATHDLADLCFVTETPSSRIWRARSAALGEVALKCIKPYGHEELDGIRYLQARDGRGAVRIHDVLGSAVVMEWLPGDTLAARVRAGRDAEASDLLARTALALQEGAVENEGLIPLESRLADLLGAGDEQLRAAYGDPGPAIRALGERLLADAPPARPLHGDLHHDNVMESPRGWLALDAKGVLGDPAYEFANAFQNPVGSAELALDPDRARQMAATFAAITGHDAERLLGWALVHAACSGLWADDGHFPPGFSRRMVTMLATLCPVPTGPDSA